MTQQQKDSPIGWSCCIEKFLILLLILLYTVVISLKMFSRFDVEELVKYLYTLSSFLISRMKAFKKEILLFYKTFVAL